VVDVYGKAQGIAAATLPATGGIALGLGDGLWMLIAGFTLITAGLALWRLFPRKEA
jgi:hypothetical protein